MQIKNRMIIFRLDINKHRQIEEKQIKNKIQQNTKNIANYEKRIEAIKFNESTTDIVEQNQNNHDIYGKDNKNQNDVNNKLLFEKNNEDKTLYSTVHNHNNEKQKNKKIFHIDINKIKEEGKQIINEKIKHIKENLTDYQKQKKVLQELKTKTNDIRDKEIYIDVHQIREKDENNINDKIDKNKNKIPNEYEKRKIAINEDESSTDYVKEKKTDVSNSFNQANISSTFEGSTLDSSKIENSQNSYELNQNQNQNQSQNPERPQKEKKEEKKFNIARSQYYMKHKLYDMPYYEQKSDIKMPDKYTINEDEKFFGYLYPDNYSTYCIIKSKYLGEDKIINEDNNKEINSKLDDLRRLYFCGKEIKINNETKNMCSRSIYL